MQLAADMQRFSRPERRINGPTISHLWCVIMIMFLLLVFVIVIVLYFLNSFVLDSRSMLKLLDVLVQLDHLKNAKASIPNDFSWYKRYVFNLCLCHFIFRLKIFNFSYRFSASVCFCYILYPFLGTLFYAHALGACKLVCIIMKRFCLFIGFPKFFNVTPVELFKFLCIRTSISN